MRRRILGLFAFLILFGAVNLGLVGFQRFADREDRAAFKQLESRLAYSSRGIDGLEKSIASLDSQLVKLKDVMDAKAREIYAAEASMRASRRMFGYAVYKKNIEEHNKLVDQFNSLALDHELQTSVYPGEVTRHNLLVDSVNAAGQKLAGTWILIPIPRSGPSKIARRNGGNAKAAH